MIPSNSASPPRRSRRRGAEGRAASSLPGDRLLGWFYAELQMILRLDSIRLEVQQQLSEIMALRDPVTSAIPAREALAHLRRLRRQQQEVAALARLVVWGPLPRPRLRRASGTNLQFRSPLTEQGYPRLTGESHRGAIHSRADIRGRGRDVPRSPGR
jgi:hypothetical protein